MSPRQYLDNNRYWISTQPNVTRTARDRASQYLEDRYKVHQEIVKRLKKDRSKEEFSAIHVAPQSTADIPDDAANLGIRLVILGPQYHHSKTTDDSPARKWVEEILNNKGSSPRYHKNTVVFLAPDKTKLEILEKNVADYLAWNAIVAEKEILNLDAFQNKQATTKLNQTDKDIAFILNETYQWLLVPAQASPQEAIEWEEIRLQGKNSPIDRASNKLINEENLITVYSATRLSLEVLEDYVWNNSDSISLKQLWGYLTQYIYLPRLKNSQVLIEAIKNGVNLVTWEEHFAYAQGYDEKKQRYSELAAQKLINPSISSQNLLVKPSVARKQIDADKAKEAEKNGEPDGKSSTKPSTGDNKVRVNGTSEIAPEPVYKRFYGSVAIDPVRINRDASAIADEIIQHLSKLSGATVEITIEIEANIPDGVSDDVRRTVIENAQTLKFKNHGFESE